MKKYVWSSILGCGLLLTSQAYAAQVSFAWDYQQGTELAVGFNFYRAATCDGPFVKLNASILPLIPLSYTDASVELVVGQTYCWKITAVDIDGEEASDPTGSRSFRIKGVLNPPRDLRKNSNS